MRNIYIISLLLGSIVASWGQTGDANSVVGVNSSVRGSLEPGDSEVFRLGGEEEETVGGAGWNVTVVAQMCSSDETCVYRDESTGFEAALSLRCGSASLDVGEYIVSSYVGGTQTVLLTPQTPNVLGEVLNCIVTSETYNAGRIEYTLSVEALDELPTLVDEERALLNTVYALCCKEEGSCGYWNDVTRQAESLNGDERVARQGVVDQEGAPAPSAEVGSGAPVPAPAVVVPSVDASGPFTDFCSLGGSMCTSDGSLQTLYLKAFGLLCDFSQVVRVLPSMTHLERLVLSENKDLSGSAVVDIEDFPIETEKRAVTDVQLDNTSVTASTSELLVDPSSNLLCRMALRGLRSLSIEDTPIGGGLGPCLFANSSLQIVHASRSNFIEITDQMSEVKSLRSIRVQGAALQGTLPVLPQNLAEIQVSDNMLEGVLPAPAENMVAYDASGNRFSGTVPDEFVDHPTLRILSLNGNQLEEIPAAWTSTTSRPSNSPPLELIYLSSNPLKTAFPAGLGLYPNMTGLYFSDTELEGPLPDLTEGAFPSLLRLHIDSNDITGTIPDSWEGINLFRRDVEVSKVRFGNFSTNSMSGELPEWLGGTILNAEYDFSGNDFSNGCEEQFKALNACPGAPSPTSNTSSVSPSPSIAPAPAPDSSKGDEESDDEGGLSGGAIAAIVIVIIIVVGIGAYFLIKKHKQSRAEGTFTRFDESGVQMTANQTYNPTLDP